MQREQFEKYFFPLDSGERPPALPNEIIDEFLSDASSFGYSRNGSGAIEGQEECTIKALVRMIDRSDTAGLMEQGYVAGPYILEHPQAGRVCYRGIMLYRRNGG